MALHKKSPRRLWGQAGSVWSGFGGYALLWILLIVLTVCPVLFLWSGFVGRFSLNGRGYVSGCGYQIESPGFYDVGKAGVKIARDELVNSFRPFPLPRIVSITRPLIIVRAVGQNGPREKNGHARDSEPNASASVPRRRPLYLVAGLLLMVLGVVLFWHGLNLIYVRDRT